jgi:hypothetical protein
MTKCRGSAHPGPPECMIWRSRNTSPAAEKDREFTQERVKQRMVRRDILMDRERGTDLSPELRKLVRVRVARDFKASPT